MKNYVDSRALLQHPRMTMTPSPGTFCLDAKYYAVTDMLYPWIPRSAGTLTLVAVRMCTRFCCDCQF